MVFQFISAILSHFFCFVLGIGGEQSFPPPLPAAEERALFLKKKQGDAQARAKLIEHNLRLVSHIIKKYYSAYEYPEELLSIGSLGLIKAVDSFKSDFGTRFATYGAKCVQNEILMYFRSRKKLSQEVSLNDTIDIDKDGNPLTYMDIISAPDTIAEDLDLKIMSEKAVKIITTYLDRREKEIIVYRYGLNGDKPLTQRELADKLKISRSYVSRIEKSALDKIKSRLLNK